MAKKRAQNCLTVSNFKLGDVFSDVFSKTASAITARILENPTEKITDVSGIYNMLMKNESYNPALYRRVDRPPAHREISLDAAIYILQRQGYLVTVPSTA